LSPRGPDFHVHWDNMSPEAARANELARELIFARAYASEAPGPNFHVFKRVLEDRVRELLGSEDQAQDLTNILGALAFVGAAAAWQGTVILSVLPEDTDVDAVSTTDWRDHLPDFLEMVAQFMVGGKGGSL
jgi:hypothetical protein